MSASAVVEDFRHRVAEAEALRSRLDRLGLDRESELGRTLRRRADEETLSPAGLRPHPSTAIDSPTSPSRSSYYGVPGYDFYPDGGHRTSGWTATSPLSAGLDDSLGSSSTSRSNSMWHSRSPASRSPTLPGSDVFAGRSGLNEDPSPPRWHDPGSRAMIHSHEGRDPVVPDNRSSQIWDPRWDITPRPDQDDRALQKPSPRKGKSRKKSAAKAKSPVLSSLLRRTTQSYLSTWESGGGANASWTSNGESKPGWRHAGGPARLKPDLTAHSVLSEPRDVDPIVEALERRIRATTGVPPGANRWLHDPKERPRRSPYATRRRERVSSSLGASRPPDRLTFSVAMKTTEKWEVTRAREEAAKAAEEEARRRPTTSGYRRLHGDGATAVYTPPRKDRDGAESSVRRYLQRRHVGGVVAVGADRGSDDGRRELMPPLRTHRGGGDLVVESPGVSAPSPAEIGAGLGHAKLGYGWKTTPTSSEWMSPTKQAPWEHD